MIAMIEHVFHNLMTIHVNVTTQESVDVLIGNMDLVVLIVLPVQPVLRDPWDQGDR